MKKLFPLLLLLFTLSKSYGQGYTPFPETNASWIDGRYTCFDYSNSYGVDERIYFNGDTTIGNFTYHRLAQEQIRSSGDCNPYDHNYAVYSDSIPFTFIGYLRQEVGSKRVYYLQDDTSAEIILYDYNLWVGKNVTGFFRTTDFQYNSATVTSIDVFSSDKAYAKYNFDLIATGESGPYHDQTSWIEGIGSSWGLLYPLSFVWNQKSLSCFSRSDSTIYPGFSLGNCRSITSSISEASLTSPSLKISPNPTTNICTINFSNNPGLYTATITDITGREIMPLFQNQHISTYTFNTTTLPSGLYFIKLNDNTGHFAVSKLVKE